MRTQLNEEEKQNIILSAKPRGYEVKFTETHVILIKNGKETKFLNELFIPDNELK